MFSPVNTELTGIIDKVNMYLYIIFKIDNSLYLLIPNLYGKSGKGRKQSNIQKLNSKIEQEKKTALKLRKKLETTKFDTVTQAQNYLKSINKKLKLWDLYSLEIKKKFFNKQSKFYHHQIETKPRVSEIERRTVAAGRFILATNIESSSDFHCSEILWNYKNQQSCERGFRFLKEPQFFADSFLSKN